MESEAFVREVLTAPGDEFTARRNARVKELKSAGLVDQARELSAVRKPSLPLRAVNRLAVDHPGLLNAERKPLNAW